MKIFHDITGDFAQSFLAQLRERFDDIDLIFVDCQPKDVHRFLVNRVSEGETCTVLCEKNLSDLYLQMSLVSKLVLVTKDVPNIIIVSWTHYDGEEKAYDYTIEEE